MSGDVEQLEPLVELESDDRVLLRPIDLYDPVELGAEEPEEILVLEGEITEV